MNHPLCNHFFEGFTTKIFIHIFHEKEQDPNTGRTFSLDKRLISEKTNDPILRKLSGTDGWTDGQMDDSDFIGRCSTKVERPIN